MGIEVFNRYEYKYKVDIETAQELMKVFNQNLNLDAYCEQHGNYKIVNHYVDTIDYQLIRKSITKPLYKHKLRIRTYNENPQNNDFVYFEIKKKFKGLVNKRRCKMTYQEAQELIKYKDLKVKNDYINLQILKEIIYILEDNDYEIKNQIIYDRIAYFDDRKNLRISFDFDVHSYDNEILEQNLTLMEIKTATAMPLWLVNVLNEHQIHKTSFSKYGIDYLKNLTTDEA